MQTYARSKAPFLALPRAALGCALFLLGSCDRLQEPGSPDQQRAAAQAVCVEQRPAFGPSVYVRGAGKPQTIVTRFCVANATGRFTLSVRIGRGGGPAQRVTSAVIELNGTQVVGPDEFKKKVDQIATPVEKRRFWATHDGVDYFDWDNAVRAPFPNLKPSTTSISIRLPVPMLEELKALANQRDVPYQSLMKVYLAERVARERLRKVPA